MDEGKLELRTVDGDWPAWAVASYPEGAADVTFRMPVLGPWSFDWARFTDPGEPSIELRLSLPATLVKGDSVTIGSRHSIVMT